MKLAKIKNYLYLVLSQYSFFWTFQLKVTKYIFFVKKLLYKSQILIEENKDTYNSYKTFRTWSFLNIFLIIIVTFVLQVFSPILEVIFKSIVFGYFTPQHVIYKFNIISNSEYITFLTAIAAIGGVFIALYFSTLAGVNATLYSTFSNNLRDLLYREKVGNTYIKFLSNTTFFAFTLIVFYLLGYEKIYIAIPIMLILIGITIFSYIKLGVYTAKLFNVDTLSITIFKNIYKYIDSAKKRNIFNRDKNFQNHYYTLTSKEINLLNSLLDVSLENYKIHNDSLQNITLNMLTLLINYQLNKRLIPYESLWYEQTQEYKDIYRMGNLSGLNISISSATMPQGETKYNLYWLEDKILPYIIKIIVNKLNNNEIEDTKNILYGFHKYIIHLVKSGNIDYAIKVSNLLKEEVKNISISNSLTLFEFVEFVYSLPLHIILNFYENINDYSYSHISEIVKTNNLINDDLQYKFHENTTETLNWLQKRLKLENKAENENISPKWYQIEIILLSISRHFITNIENLKDILNEYFIVDLEDDIQIHSTILSQKWETVNKFLYQIYKIEEVLKENEKAIRIKGLDWKKITYKKLKNDIELIKKNTIVEIAQIMYKIEERKDNKSRDILGYFLQITSENLLDLSIEKQFEDITNVYISFFLSSFKKYDSLRPTFDPEIENLDERKKYEFRVSFHPIINLIEVTGLIKVLLEYYNEVDTWKKIENMWLSLFNKESNYMTPEQIELFINMTEEHFAIPVGDEQRFNWRNKVFSFLEKNIKKDTFVRNRSHTYYSLQSKTIILHKSPIVREFIGDRTYSDDDGITVFIYTILNKNYPDRKFNFGWKRDEERFDKKIKKNIEIYEEYKNARN